MPGFTLFCAAAEYDACNQFCGRGRKCLRSSVEHLVKTPFGICPWGFAKPNVQGFPVRENGLVKMVVICPRRVRGGITTRHVAMEVEFFSVWNQVVELLGNFAPVDGDGGTGFFVASEMLPPESETLLQRLSAVVARMSFIGHDWMWLAMPKMGICESNRPLMRD
ncbi:MAG: hypothetical protein ABIP20_15405 [Chthoniobacteraceae bacterium]